MLGTRVARLDEVLSAHAGALGADFEGYRHHEYRVANFCFGLTSTATAAERGGAAQMPRRARGDRDRSRIKEATRSASARRTPRPRSSTIRETRPPRPGC